jgi:hypothetical protein
MSIRMNAQLQLMCLVSLRLEELWVALGERARCGWAVELNYNRVLALMLTGQRLELTRDGWGAGAYQRVAELSAGEQYAFYFRLIAAASDGRMNEWSETGHALGTLLQLVADWESADERLMSLGQDTAVEFRTRFTHKIVDQARRLGPVFDLALEAILSRVKQECR